MKKERTHLDKVFWPREKYTKGDLIEYYERIAPFILPYVKDRPCATNRFPDGIKGGHFFQKNYEGDLPDFVHTATERAKTTGKSVRYILCNNRETLAYLANLGVIELHPWSSRRGSLLKPDWMIFDLDPGTKASFADVIKVAQMLRRVLEAAHMRSVPKTSGKRGIHVYVPVRGRYSYERVRKLARELAERVVEELPETASLEHWPNKRKDKIFLDIGRNAKGQTAVAPYSVRPVPGAPVSTPLAWREVKKGLDPSRFTIKTIFTRLKKKGDLFKGAR